MNQQLPSKFLKFIIYVLRPYKWWLLATITFASISGCGSVINSYLTKLLINIVANVSNEQLFQTALLPAILFCVNFEIQTLSWRGINYVNITIVPEVKNKLIEQLMSYLYKHSFRYFQDNLAGTVASNINRIVDCVEEIVTMYISQLTKTFVQLVCAIVGMYFVHRFFSIILICWVAIFFKISYTYSKKVIALGDEYAESKAEVSGKVTDSIASSINVRLFAREKFEISSLWYWLKNMADKYRKKDWFLLKLWCVQGFSVTILIGVMAITLLKLKTQNLITVGDFAFILSLTVYVAENIWWITEQIDRMNVSIGNCNQALKSLIVPHEIIDQEDAKPLIVNEGSIAFNDVSFNYKHKDDFFHNKSVIIAGGQKVGLVGYSGSGKTTFVNLIVRLFDVSNGTISIDGQNITYITQESLREHIGFIPQDPILFHRSLRENIRYGRIDASDEGIIDAARRAHAHEFIIDTHDGYESLVGERGIKLSGGQRQRIAIARAILKNAPILVLDEATSALDSVTESYIQESLKELMQGKTVIAIAHRLSTLLSMDRILVFDQDSIVEDGTHDELVGRGGMYTKLWSSQVGGFLVDSQDENA